MNKSSNNIINKEVTINFMFEKFSYSFLLV